MNRPASLLIVVATAAVLIAGGCSRKIYVPVEHIIMHRDSIGTVTTRIDTVLHTDSVVIDRRGDTVYHTAWRLRERVSRHTDTIVRTAHDTVTRTITVADKTDPPKKSRFSDRVRNIWHTLSGYITIALVILLILKIVSHRITRRNN